MSNLTAHSPEEICAAYFATRDRYSALIDNHKAADAAVQDEPTLRNIAAYTLATMELEANLAEQDRWAPFVKDAMAALEAKEA